MIRLLYRCLVGLHPRTFRDQYGGEMLWIFEEATECGGVVAMLADGFLSLLRQWLLRSGAWKMAAGGMVSFLVISGMMAGAGQPPGPHRVWPQPVRRCPAPCAPADFRGHWAGNFHWPAPAEAMELTLTKTGEAWNGELQMQGPDGVRHPGVAEDIQFEGGQVSFRVQTNRGPLRFHGWMEKGKLTGALEPADGSSF